MGNQSFTARQFSYLVRQGDYWKYFKADTDPDRKKFKDETLEKIEKNLQADKYQFSGLTSFTANKKTVFSLPKIKQDKSNRMQVISDDFILRKINQNIGRIYKVKQADRFQIISNVKTLLSQPSPFYVCQLDIKSFYETINRKKISNDIELSALVSHETKILLRKFFDSLPPAITGLPRGINISATLSEYCMKKFDRFMRGQKTIFYYARFVDDIIIFSTEKITKSQIREMGKNLPEGLSFNSNKQYLHDLSVKKSGTLEISYLGYEFECSIEPNKSRRIKTRIAKKKISKIKQKVVTAVLAYKAQPNLKLLKDRLLFLTATYPLKTQRQKLSRYETAGYLHGGIFYSYPLIDDQKCLQDLDTFLHALLSSAKFNRITSGLTPAVKQELKKYSFVQGYNRRISRKFKPDYIGKITACWG